MNKEEEIKKEIEGLENNAKENYKKNMYIYHSCSNKARYLKAELKGIQERDKEIEDEIDNLDIELFLEDVVDVKTGKRVKLPKEIWDLWFIYWEHIKEKLKSRLKLGENYDKYFPCSNPERLLAELDEEKREWKDVKYAIGIM